MVPPYYTVGKNLKRQARHCGVYEWGAKRPLLGQPKNRVVYVGSGSHKDDLLNDALLREYELWVRVKVSTRYPRKLNAERMENKMENKKNQRKSYTKRIAMSRPHQSLNGNRNKRL